MLRGECKHSSDKFSLFHYRTHLNFLHRRLLHFCTSMAAQNQTNSFRTQLHQSLSVILCEVHRDHLLYSRHSRTINQLVALVDARAPGDVVYDNITKCFPQRGKCGVQQLYTLTEWLKEEATPTEVVEAAAPLAVSCIYLHTTKSCCSEQGSKQAHGVE